MECRLSAPSILIIYPLPNVTVSERPFAVSRKRDGLKCVGRFLSHADSGTRSLTDHEALHHLQRSGIRQPTDSRAAFHFEFATRNIVTLLENTVLLGISGVAVGELAGNALAGAAGAAFNRVAGVIGNDVPEFRLIFRRGAFDLARRLNRDLQTKNARTLGLRPYPRGDCRPRPGIGPGQPPVHMAVRDMLGCGARRFRAYVGHSERIPNSRAGYVSRGGGVANCPSIHRGADPAAQSQHNGRRPRRGGVGATTQANRSAHSLNPVLTRQARSS
jgi:hypothetical protein